MKQTKPGARVRQLANGWTAHHLRLLAVDGHVDPRTAKRWLLGFKVASTTSVRLMEALARLRDKNLLPELGQR